MGFQFDSFCGYSAEKESGAWGDMTLASGYHDRRATPKAGHSLEVLQPVLSEKLDFRYSIEKVSNLGNDRMKD
ncbi:hypothetical protein AVEN_27975-1 [Araneus ventricosus]|uniref:Uncharacterized protein n=1 Tax=Araneus ventricosus TaxID=182803 RepID=A0A4Y2BF15_ARAVE|nr:hypothetical protein AVEN_27975-1 [Araneus ventricosus]